MVILCAIKEDKLFENCFRGSKWGGKRCTRSLSQLLNLAYYFRSPVSLEGQNKSQRMKQRNKNVID